MLPFVAVALVLGILGVPVERGLAPSDRVQIHGTDLVVTVPERWSGTETRYLPLSAQRSDPSAVFSQEVWLTSGPQTLDIFLYKDGSELRDIGSRLARNDSIFKPLSLDGTSFEPAIWQAWSSGSAESCIVMLIGRPDSQYAKVQIMIKKHEEGSTTRSSDLLDILDGMMSR